MKIFAIDIEGRPILAMSARSEAEIRAALDKGGWLRGELIALQNERVPLWDEESDLSIREASGHERERFWEAHEAAIANGNRDPKDPDPFAFFLVPVIDPKAERRSARGDVA